MSDKVKELHSTQQEIVHEKLPELNKRLLEFERKNTNEVNSIDAIATQNIKAEINEQKNISRNVMIFNLKDNLMKRKI